MRDATAQLLESTNLGVLCVQYPQVNDLLMSLRLEVLDEELTLVENLERLAEQYFADFGTTRVRFVEDIGRVIEQRDDDGGREPMHIRSIQIHGGRDKAGEAEIDGVTLTCGEVVGIVGKTGAGKSQLLADIESLAQDDTPTHRTILIDGVAPDEELRMATDNQLVAQLSQNMNFIMDHTVERFLHIHAQCREVDGERVVGEVFSYANELSGESFDLSTPVTQLSGGQSRALMIADTLLLSSSPVILVDEIENAGIDRKKAVELLSRTDKIVLISTHDPLLALSCPRRLVIKNGGIAKVIERDEAEERNREVLDAYDRKVTDLREALREGEHISIDLAALFAKP